MQQPSLLRYAMRSFLATIGNPLNKTAFATVNTVAFTPIPTASVATATAVKPGFFAKLRTPKATSVSQDMQIKTPECGAK